VNTCKSWPFALKWGGQRKGKWEFAPHASGVSVLICHNATLILELISPKNKKKNPLKSQIRNLIEDANAQVNASKNKWTADELALPDYFGRKPIEVGNVRKLEKKNRSAKVWRLIPVHHHWNQRKNWTQDPPVWPPTKPPTDRHSANFTKEHKSLKSFICEATIVRNLSLIWMKEIIGRLLWRKKVWFCL